MKAPDGFTRPLPTAITAVAVAGSLTALALAMRTNPVSLAYPIWTAAGAAGAVLFGVILFDESITPLKIAGLGAIVIGVATQRAAA